MEGWTQPADDNRKIRLDSKKPRWDKPFHGLTRTNPGQAKKLMPQ